MCSEDTSAIIAAVRPAPNEEALSSDHMCRMLQQLIQACTDSRLGTSTYTIDPQCRNQSDIVQSLARNQQGGGSADPGTVSLEVRYGPQML